MLRTPTRPVPPVLLSRWKSFRSAKSTRQTRLSRPIIWPFHERRRSHFAEPEIKEWACRPTELCRQGCRNAFLAAVLSGSNSQGRFGRSGRSVCFDLRVDRTGGCPGRQADRHEVRTHMSRSSIALSNLRAVVIVIVLAFHSVLAYLASLPASPHRFDDAPYLWQAIPIVDSHRWFALRPVLRLAGCQPDVADVLSFRPVRAVEPGAQGKHHVPFRPVFPDRPAARPGGRVPDAGDVLPDLSRDRRRSERQRLLATPDGAAVLAVRPAVVPVAAPGAQRAGGRPASLRAAMERKSRRVWRHRRARIRSGSLSCWSRCRRWPTCRWL